GEHEEISSAIDAAQVEIDSSTTIPPTDLEKDNTVFNDHNNETVEGTKDFEKADKENAAEPISVLDIPEQAEEPVESNKDSDIPLIQGKGKDEDYLAYKEYVMSKKKSPTSQFQLFSEPTPNILSQTLGTKQNPVEITSLGRYDFCVDQYPGGQPTELWFAFEIAEDMEIKIEGVDGPEFFAEGFNVQYIQYTVLYDGTGTNVIGRTFWEPMYLSLTAGRYLIKAQNAYGHPGGEPQYYDAIYEGSYSYIINQALTPPTLSANSATGGVYPTTQLVEFSAVPAGQKILYSTENSYPQDNGIEYLNTPVEISQSCSLWATTVVLDEFSNVIDYSRIIRLVFIISDQALPAITYVNDPQDAVTNEYTEDDLIYWQMDVTQSGYYAIQSAASSWGYYTYDWTLYDSSLNVITEGRSPIGSEDSASPINVYISNPGIYYFSFQVYYQETFKPKFWKLLQPPTISPDGGSFDTLQTVAINAPNGEDIYYKIVEFINVWDDPYADSVLYSAPITIRYDSTIMTYVQSGNNKSPVVNATFNFDNAPTEPTFNVDYDNVYPVGYQLEITSQGNDIYYLFSSDYFNSEEIYNQGTKYTGPITLDKSMEEYGYIYINAVSVNSYGIISGVSGVNLRLGIAKPTIMPSTSHSVVSFDTPQLVTLTSTDSSFKIYYNINSQYEPDSSDILYTGTPIAVDTATYLKARVYDELNSEWSDSEYAYYHINQPKLLQEGTEYNNCLVYYEPDNENQYKINISADGDYSIQLEKSNSYSNLSMTLYDSVGNVVANGVNNGNIINIETSLTQGEYTLSVISGEYYSFAYYSISYKKSISMPKFTEPQSYYESGKWYNAYSSPTVIHITAEEGTNIYYGINTTPNTLYDSQTGLTLAYDNYYYSVTIYAYAEKEGVISQQASAEYYIDSYKPQFNYPSGGRYQYSKDNGENYNNFSNYSPSPSVLYGEVLLKTKSNSVYDYGTGVEKVKYYISTDNGESFSYLGEAGINDALVWDTTQTVSTEASGVILKSLLVDYVGNISDDDPYQSYASYPFTIKNVPTTPTQNVTLLADKAKITVNWQSVDGASQYHVYRAESREQLDITTTPVYSCNYYDTYYSEWFYNPFDVGKQYYYAVTVVDARGIESQRAYPQEGFAVPIADAELPEIWIGVSDGQITNTNSLYFDANDNVSIVKFKAEITPQNSNVITLFDLTYDNYTAYRSENIDISMLEDGDYALDVTCYDSFSNMSTKNITFTIDRTAPEIVTGVTASTLPLGVRLDWQASASTDLNYYSIYVADQQDGNFSQYTSTYSDTTSYNVYADDTKIGLSAYFKIIAQDIAGNTSEFSQAVSGIYGDYVPRLRIAEQPSPGKSLYIYYSGFKYGETINFYLDQSQTPFQTATSGEYENAFLFEIPYSFTGTHSIRAKGMSEAVGNEKTREVTFKFAVVDFAAGLTVPEKNVLAGSNLNYTFSGFPSSKYVKIYLDDTYMQEQYTYQGDTSGYIAIPSDAATGKALLRVVNEEAGIEISESITIQTRVNSVPIITATPTGTGKINLQVSNYSAYEQIELYVNGEKQSDVTANYYGSYGIYPYSLPGIGQYEKFLIKTIGKTNGKVAELIYEAPELMPALSVDQTIILGQSFSMGISGFLYNENVDIYIDDTLITTKQTNSEGSITHNYTFVYNNELSTLGGHIIKVKGDTSNLEKTARIVLTAPDQTLTLMTEPILTQTLQLFVTGFIPSESVRFYLNGQLLGSANADSNGDASYIINSLDEISPYVFMAVGNTSGFSAHSLWAEQGDSLSVNYQGNAIPGGNIVLSVSGLLPGEAFELYINNYITLTDVSDENGTKTINVTIPSNYEKNSIAILIMGTNSFKSKELTVPVTITAPSITVSPSSTNAGSGITISYQGFIPNEDIIYYFDNRQIILTGNEYILPPYIDEGTYEVIAIGSISKKLAKTNVNVGAYTPELTLSNYNPIPKDSLNITVSDLIESDNVALYSDNNLLTTQGSISPVNGEVNIEHNLSPNIIPGEHTIKAVLEESITEITKTFSVASVIPSVEVSQGEGFSAVLNISGFLPNEILDIFYDNRLVTNFPSTQADGNGALVLQYQFSVFTSPGIHGFRAVGRESKARAFSNYEVTVQGPILSALNVHGYAEGKGGMTINLTAVNFDGNVAVKVYFNDIDITPLNAVTNGDGILNTVYTLPEFMEDGIYRFKVEASSTGQIALADVKIDTTPPDIPVVFAASTKREITLSWNKVNAPDVDSYMIYRKAVDDSEYMQVAEIEETANSIIQTFSLEPSINTVSAGKTYSYLVYAIDRLGNQSSASQTVETSLLQDRV
ncbi:MAG: hypothetical protein GX800_07180, partial [Clostridiaceae bacterium]|nr:hypothetical protein [Clostridiaceae bacterium]